MAVIQSEEALLAILWELRMMNQQLAEQNGRVDELQKLRLDGQLAFPLLTTRTIPTN